MPSPPPPSPYGLARRVPTWVVLAAFLGMVLVLSHRAIEHHADGGRGPDRWAMIDFQDTLYYPAVAFLAGKNPWAPSFADNYPVQRPLPPYGPIVVLAHLPLGFLSVRVAEVAYFALTIGLTAAIARLVLGVCGLDVGLRSVLVLATVMLASRPGSQSILAGQCTLEVVLGCYLALLYGRTRPMLGAASIALASMKPQFALPLVLLTLARGDLRTAVGGVVATGGLSLATLLVAGGVDGPKTWLAAIARSSATVADASLLWPRIDAGFFARHTLELPEGSDLVAAAAVLVLGLVAFRRASATELATASRGTAAALACLVVLLPVYHMAYDALLLTLPIVALIGDRSTPAWRARPTAYAALIALLLVPAVNFAATNTVVENLAPHTPAWRVVTGINAGALVSALLLASWLTLRPARSTAATSASAAA